MCIWNYVCYFMLEEVIKWAWPPLDLTAGPRQSEAPHPYLPSLEYTFFPLFPQWELFQDAALKDYGVVEAIWTEYMAKPS